MNRWRPTPRFLLVGGAFAVGIGVIVNFLIGLSTGRLDPGMLIWNGLSSLLVFTIICALVSLSLHRIHRSTGLRRALLLATLFFAGGALAWVLIRALLYLIGGTALPPAREAGLHLLVNGSFGVLFGSAFYVYEAMRQRLMESVSRLKEAEFAEKELQLARSIQRRLLPPTELSGPGYRIAARNQPATYVAGDFFDVFALADASLGMVVADVAGKGVGASLIMASVKAMLPLLAAGRSAPETLIALNEKLCDELEARQFVALVYARFEPSSGELVVANAGMPDPYLLRSGTRAETLPVAGPRMPLGLRRDQRYRAASAVLAPGTGLLLTSDGLPEAPDAAGDPLGYEALAELLPPLDGAPGPWLDDLFQRVRRRTAPTPADDWTALLLDRRGDGAGNAR